MEREQKNGEKSALVTMSFLGQIYFGINLINPTDIRGQLVEFCLEWGYLKVH